MGHEWQASCGEALRRERSSEGWQLSAVFCPGRVERFISGHYAKGLATVLANDSEFKGLFETWSKTFFVEIQRDMRADHSMQSLVHINSVMIDYEQAEVALDAFKSSFNVADLQVAMMEPPEDYDPQDYDPEDYDIAEMDDSYESDAMAEMASFIPRAVKPTVAEIAEIERKEFQQRQELEDALAAIRADQSVVSPPPPPPPAPAPLAASPKPQQVRRRRRAQDIAAGSPPPDSKVSTDDIDPPVSKKQRRS
jgi:hypothetical protein